MDASFFAFMATDFFLGKSRQNRFLPISRTYGDTLDDFLRMN